MNKKDHTLAEKAWENINNEGSISQKEYWIDGFTAGLNENKFNLTKEVKEALFWSFVYGISIATYFIAVQLIVK
jgi:hypothetical protein